MPIRADLGESEMVPKTQPETPAKKSSKKARLLALAFAVAALGFLAVNGYRGRQRYLQEHPAPLPEVIPPIPPAEQERLRVGIQLLGIGVLGFTAEQSKQVDAIWQRLPRSLNEVIDYLKRTNAVMTPVQQAKFRQYRVRYTEEMVDRILEPARKRFKPDDFEKFEKEIKTRVEHRISGS